MKTSKYKIGNFLIATGAVLFLAGIVIVLSWARSMPQFKHEGNADTVYQIVRDTVYIDRSRPVNKPWYSYEIESGEDSIYLYSGRELIGVVGRKEATVFYIDSLIIADNL